jgi:hypothetical protein
MPPSDVSVAFAPAIGAGGPPGEFLARAPDYFEYLRARSREALARHTAARPWYIVPSFFSAIVLQRSCAFLYAFFTPEPALSTNSGSHFDCTIAASALSKEDPV